MGNEHGNPGRAEGEVNGDVVKKKRRHEHKDLNPNAACLVRAIMNMFNGSGNPWLEGQGAAEGGKKALLDEWMANARRARHLFPRVAAQARAA